MTTRYIALSSGTINIISTSVKTMQIFIEINNFEGDKNAFKMPYDEQNITLVVISYYILFNSPKARLIHSI